MHDVTTQVSDIDEALAAVERFLRDEAAADGPVAQQLLLVEWPRLRAALAEAEAKIARVEDLVAYLQKGDHSRWVIRQIRAALAAPADLPPQTDDGFGPDADLGRFAAPADDSEATA